MKKIIAIGLLLVALSGCIRIGGGTGTDTIAQVNHEFLNVTTITFTHGGRSDCNCYILPHDLVTIAEEASRNQKPVDFTFDQDLLPNFGDTTNYRVTSLRYR